MTEGPFICEFFTVLFWSNWPQKLSKMTSFIVFRCLNFTAQVYLPDSISYVADVEAETAFKIITNGHFASKLLKYDRGARFPGRHSAEVIFPERYKSHTCFFNGVSRQRHSMGYWRLGRTAVLPFPSREMPDALLIAPFFCYHPIFAQGSSPRPCLATLLL